MTITMEVMHIEYGEMYDDRDAARYAARRELALFLDRLMISLKTCKITLLLLKCL